MVNTLSAPSRLVLRGLTETRVRCLCSLGAVVPNDTPKQGFHLAPSHLIRVISARSARSPRRRHPSSCRSAQAAPTNARLSTEREDERGEWGAGGRRRLPFAVLVDLITDLITPVLNSNIRLFLALTLLCAIYSNGSVTKRKSFPTFGGDNFCSGNL